MLPSLSQCGNAYHRAGMQSQTIKIHIINPKLGYRFQSVLFTIQTLAVIIALFFQTADGFEPNLKEVSILPHFSTESNKCF